MKIIAVRTNPASGLAEFGTVEIDLSERPLDPQGDKEKEPDAEAAPHHPPAGTPILLRIKRGTHTIFVPTADGAAEQPCELKAGDAILFCDFAPAKPPQNGGRFSYAGHRSKAGPEGALLSPSAVRGWLHLEELGWKDGLPS